MYERQRWCAYKFISRHSLMFRRPTGVSQYKTEESSARKTQFAQSNVTVVHMNGKKEHYIVNMDETAVYFDSNHDYTNNERGAKKVSVDDEVVRPTKDALFALL